MRETPPNILITNYSMMEYMLLRPNDDAVFSNSKLKFIVLDEAHIYKGATGMETSLLMRRVRARISEEAEVRYILTSATLGGKDADDEILKFANNLCGAVFREDDIIRSVEKEVVVKESKDFPSSIFTELVENQGDICNVLKNNSAIFLSSGSDDEQLYELFLHSGLFSDFRQYVKNPLTLKELHNKLSKTHNISLKELVDFISVCAWAEKDGASLIKPRYHLFVRALEGLFLGIGETKEVFLQQKDHISLSEEEEKVIFEAAVCSDCGRLALVGKLEGNYLRQVQRFDDGIEFYLLKEAEQEDFIEDEDQSEDVAEETSCDDYVVCSLCGAMDTKLGAELSSLCEHEKRHYYYVKKAQTKQKRAANRMNAPCPACGFGNFMQLYLGANAATGVLGTGLFELLPKEEFIIEEKNKQGVVISDFDNPFAAATVEEVKPKRDIMPQFLCFSDSRSEAAYFATYMERNYQEFLRRRGMWHVADNLREQGHSVVDMEFFHRELSRYFQNHKTFLEWSAFGTESSDILMAKSREQAWISILNEMFNARRGTSLPSLGAISFRYKKNEKVFESFARKYEISNEDARALLELLVLDIVYHGAIHPSKNEALTEAEHEYIFFSKMPKKVIKLKEGDQKSYITGWLPRKYTNGNHYRNTRMLRLKRDLNVSENEAVEILELYWKSVLSPTEEQLSLSADAFEIHLNSTFYRCQKCGRLTAHSVNKHCSFIKCSGTLELCHPLEENANNHYVKLYKNKAMSPLHIKEHTAQLSKSQQTTYQEAFQNKQIHALSCSTTFEMGVDLGSLETVYLRDVPPSPANYVQRAGRAGRGKNSAAFVLTYAKLSSHDFHFFQNPTEMIRGEIKVPVFRTENDKIVKRHIFAVALSKFFKHHENVYAENNQTVLLNKGGYEVLKEYLTDIPKDLIDLLKKSIPESCHKTMGILDGSWTELLCGEEVGQEGLLELAVKDFRATVDNIEKELKKARKNKDDGAASHWSRTLSGFRAANEDNNGRNRKQLIDFLVRSNVLPKYGFPVDTVELAPPIGMATQYKDVQLQRDLQMAIAEYAPGAEVVADGKLYTSRYLRKIPGRSKETSWEQGLYCPKCPHCEQPNFTKEPMTKEGRTCISCQNMIPKKYWAKTIEPRMGFFAEPLTKDVPMRRPERDYKTDDYYIGDSQRNIIDVLGFSVEGQDLFLESTSNDSLVVIGQEEYQVCFNCGYTGNTIPEGHKTSQGYVCANKSFENKNYFHLSHDFKTDVVKLSFYCDGAKNRSLMLSVLYGVLEGISEELGIERTDLKGCLFYNSLGSIQGYSLILYDAVAGGAGHVRRIATSDGVVLKSVLQKAYKILDRCSCDTSCYQCLRNYYNQKIHDELSRKGAMEFLLQWLGNYEVLVVEKPEKEVVTVLIEETTEDDVFLSEDTIKASEEKTWEMLCQSYQLEYSLAEWDEIQISMDCSAWPTLNFSGKELSPAFVWFEEKVAVFDLLDDFMNIDFVKYGWDFYDMNISPEELAKRLRGE